MAAVVIVLLASCSSGYGKVMTYEGHYITEDKYYYWLSTYKRNILYSYSDAYDIPSFWQSGAPDGRTVEEFFTETINNRISDYLIAEVLFRQMKLSLSDSARTEIESNISEKLDYYGGRAGLNEELKNIMLNVRTLKEVYTAEARLEAVQKALFGDGGEYEITENDVREYFCSKYSRIKYIVFYTERVLKDSDGGVLYDDEGIPVTEELNETEKNERLKKIDNCLAELRAGADFDEVRKKYSEYDTSAYPNGFLVSVNEIQTWGPQIVTAVSGTEVNGIARVEEDFATYIIVRLPLDDIASLDETDMSQISSIATYVMNEKYEDFFSTLRENVQTDAELLKKYKLSEIKPNPYYAF